LFTSILLNYIDYIGAVGHNWYSYLLKCSAFTPSCANGNDARFAERKFFQSPPQNEWVFSIDYSI